ncbi:transcriptional regulator with XRE-family HTH domain [Bacillus mesophilus]|uniref:Helix-turn-helix transcriptional regulator n=1 Tax=Bacillus mesophilus TaxID=1808955 RepID=A0A6M0QB54_9BACI|nr:transcriptional regulator with XRE-family HTH domain [Bacillus mesophilus]NEY73542.1 helix-turn-helix transcriptional regulator [Bacillus mesophilus]
MLGEQIRKFRKLKKLTLEELAGTELTKGMLSLIENNKAKPSMDSLTYIAERLEVEVSELLEEGNIQELREVLDKAEMIFNKTMDESPDKYKKLISLIQPTVSKLNQGYEAARLLELYGRGLYWEKKDNWQEPCDAAATLYDQMNLTQQRGAIGLFRAIIKFVEHDYETSLDILLKERKEIENNHVFIDGMTKLDLDYHEAMLHFAVGDTTSAKQVMEKAITFSKTNKLFYRIDDLYRLASASALMENDLASHEFYLDKLKQYAEFTDDEKSNLFYQLFNIESLNTLKQDYQLALKQVSSLLVERQHDDLKEWLYLEKGKALLGLGQVEEAIGYFDKIVTPANHHHPFDLSQFYLKDTFKAKCYIELGDTQKALAAAKIAKENFEKLPPSPYKEYSLKVYQELANK